jgi:hypothetical protein
MARLIQRAGKPEQRIATSSIRPYCCLLQSAILVKFAQRVKIFVTRDLWDSFRKNAGSDIFAPGETYLPEKQFFSQNSVSLRVFRKPQRSTALRILASKLDFKVIPPTRIDQEDEQ